MVMRDLDRVLAHASAHRTWTLCQASVSHVSQRISAQEQIEINFKP